MDNLEQFLKLPQIPLRAEETSKNDVMDNEKSYAIHRYERLLEKLILEFNKLHARFNGQCVQSFND